MIITCNGYKFFYNWFIHGVTLAEASECIFSTQAIVTEDEKHSTPTERRFGLVSISPKGRILWVGYCKRQQGLETRIISARAASKKERKSYQAVYGDAASFQAIPHNKPKIIMKFLFW